MLFRMPIPRKLTAGMIMVIMATLVIVSELSFQLYLHSKHRVMVHDIELKEQEVMRAKSSGLSLLDSDELVRLQKRVGAFKRGFVSASQTALILDGISDQAERNGVRVVGAHSDQPSLLEGDGGVDFEMNDAKYYNLSIKIEIEGSTRSVADFLRAMALSSERIFVVDSLVMSKIAGGRPGLVTCALTISFFQTMGRFP